MIHLLLLLASLAPGAPEGGATLTGVVGTLAVRPGHRLSGRVLLADGKLVPAGAEVFLLLFRDEAAFADGMAADIGPDGAVAFARPPAGRYALEMRMRGYYLSPKNRSYNLLSRDSQLLGKVDHDLNGLRLLVELGSPPARRGPNRLPRDEARKLIEEYQRRRERPLQGVDPD